MTGAGNSEVRAEEHDHARQIVARCGEILPLEEGRLRVPAASGNPRSGERDYATSRQSPANSSTLCTKSAASSASRDDDQDAARPLYYSLYAPSSTRGQESAGIITDGFQQHDHVEMGLVGDAFGPDDLESLNGTCQRHRSRPLTHRGGVDSLLVPSHFSVSFKSGSLGLSHNRNLVNAGGSARNWPGLGHAFTRATATRRSSPTTWRAICSEADLVRAVGGRCRVSTDRTR